jgi:DNA-binding Lrp family transcriptional regulator
LIDPINQNPATKATVIGMANLDETDRRILTVLDTDPRRPVALIAQDLNLARGTVHARLDRLESGGYLRAHSSRILPQALGRGVAASILVELDQHQITAAIDALSKVPEVLECFAPAGDTDLLLRVVAKSPEDLYRVAEVVRLCPGILRTSTSLFLREVIPYRVSALLQAE